MTNRRYLISIVLAGLILIFSSVLFLFSLPPTLGQTKKNLPNTQNQKVLGSNLDAESEKAMVSRVVDGDTIEVRLNGQVKHLRYIGVDTPETVDPRRPVGCFGKEASLENKRLVEGKTVILRKDVSSVDKFGRLLRYVYLPLEDRTILFINDYLVREGFAIAKAYPPDVEFASRFVAAQKEAMDEKRGLWQFCKT